MLAFGLMLHAIYLGVIISTDMLGISKAVALFSKQLLEESIQLIGNALFNRFSQCLKASHRRWWSIWRPSVATSCLISRTESYFNRDRAKMEWMCFEVRSNTQHVQATFHAETLNRKGKLDNFLETSRAQDEKCCLQVK